MMTDIMNDRAREAGTMMVKHGSLQIEAKGANDYVTDVDKEVQNMLIEKLGQAVPDAFFIAEEKKNNKLPDGEGFVIDPIDGTLNFMNGIPCSAVCIAHVTDKEVLDAVVYNPFRDEMFWASKEQGAFLNDQKIHIADRPIKKALVLTEDTWQGHKEIIRNYAVGARILGSAELAICFVASGRAGGYISQSLHMWDYAAGKLILEEAGGILLEKDGSHACLLGPNEIIACAPDQQDIFIAMCKEAEGR